ncbi:MAG: anthranilate phosphoribosyltransferase [Maribacter sp.]
MEFSRPQRSQRVPMKKLLQRLHQHETLSRQEAKQALVDITNGQMNDAQLASFITAFLMRSISIDELMGFREALLELCIKVDLGGIESIDIVGTGGDEKDTFNISTLSCFLVAGAGYKVTKHGNYGSSSVSGSSNTLEKLGYQFTNDIDTLKKQLDKANICFFHAPKFHPAMKSVAGVRKQLGLRTFFNLLGPLVNPCIPTHQLLGTSSLEISRLYHYVMQASGQQYSIVHALDGYDEISLTGKVDIKNNSGHQVLNPSDFNKPQLTAKQLQGGETQAEAVKIFKNILEGNGTEAQIDVVTTNAGIAIKTIKPQQSIEDCIQEATESLNSKKALEKLLMIT